MKPLLALLVVVVIALVAWAVVAVSPEPSEGKGGIEAAGEVAVEGVALPESGVGKEPAGSARALVASDRVIEYQLVDGESGAGLAAARIHKLKDGSLIAECDADGRARTTEPDPGQLYFYAEDYLLGVFLPDRRQLTELRAQAGEGSVTVPLYRDLISFPLEINYSLADGGDAEDVQCEITLLEAEARLAEFGSKFSGQTEAMKRAWENQQNAPKVLRPILDQPARRELLPTAQLRLNLEGNYRFVAVAAGGLLADKSMWISRETRSVTLDLVRGMTITGRVVDQTTGAPIQGVTIKSKPGLAARWPKDDPTDADGRFTVYSLGMDARRLSFSHNSYKGLVREEVLPGSALSLAMVPLERWDLRGRVLVRGSRVPIPGAQLKVSNIEAVTAEDGSFVLNGIPDKDDLELTVNAKGFLPATWLLWMLDKAEQEFSVTPGSPEGRVDAGITSLLSGRVLYEDGKPVVGMDLRLSVDGEPVPGKQTPDLSDWGRGMVDLSKYDPGSMFFPSGSARTDADGNFTFECGIPGLATIETTDSHAASTTVQVTLGREYKDLTITTRK